MCFILLVSGASHGVIASFGCCVKSALKPGALGGGGRGTRPDDAVFEAEH